MEEAVPAGAPELSEEEKTFQPNGEFVWEVRDFKNATGKMRSDIFEVGAFKWQLLFCPRGNGTDFLNKTSLFLCVPDLDEQGFGPRQAKFDCQIVCNGPVKDKFRKFAHHMFEKGTDWGYNDFSDRGVVLNPSSKCMHGKNIFLKVRIQVIPESEPAAQEQDCKSSMDRNQSFDGVLEEQRQMYEKALATGMELRGQLTALMTQNAQIQNRWSSEMADGEQRRVRLQRNLQSALDQITSLKEKLKHAKTAQKTAEQERDGLKELLYLTRGSKDVIKLEKDSTGSWTVIGRQTEK